MDWIKYPYRARARFNRNDPTVSTIQWTVARPDAPLLGIGSRICNLCLELDKEIYDDPVGEIWEGGRRAYWARTPPGIDGRHRCGTDADFMNGGTQDATPPLPQYGAFGWPLCCSPPRALYGGAGAGGSPYVSVVPAQTLYGFAGGGGRAQVGQSVVYPPTGGLTLYAVVFPVTRYSFPPSGGLTLYAVVFPSVVASFPPTGGLTLYAVVFPVIRYSFPPSGGLTLYAVVFPSVVASFPPSGGLTLYAVVFPSVVASFPPTGGLTLYAVVFPVIRYSFPPSGGLTLYAEVSPTVAGSLFTSNQTGGGYSFASNITLVGGSGVELIPGTGEVTITAVGTPPPGNPIALTAGAGNAQIPLSWTAPGGAPAAATYNVYFATDSSMSGASLFATTSATSETVTGLTNGTEYYFGVVAVSAAGAVSSFSSIVGATPVNDVVLDTYTAPNGTNPTTRAPDIGTAPAALVGSFQINSDACAAVTGTGVKTLLNYSCGTGKTDQIVNVSSTLTKGAGSTGSAIVVYARVSDANNYYAVFWDAPFTGYYIIKVVGGTQTTLSHVTTFPVTGYSTFGISVSGSTISAIANGSVLSSVTDSSLTTGTGAGVGDYYDNVNYTSRPTFDNFTVQ